MLDQFGQPKPVIDPAAFERNVRKHAQALNKRHGTDFRYAGGAPVPGARTAAAPGPGGGGDDPLGLRG